jgi:hypothetical protein
MVPLTSTTGHYFASWGSAEKKVPGELLCPSPSINFSHAFVENRDSILKTRKVHPEG